MHFEKETIEETRSIVGNGLWVTRRGDTIMIGKMIEIGSRKPIRSSPIIALDVGDGNLDINEEWVKRVEAKRLSNDRWEGFTRALFDGLPPQAMHGLWRLLRPRPVDSHTQAEWVEYFNNIVDGEIKFRGIGKKRKRIIGGALKRMGLRKVEENDKVNMDN